VTVQLLATFILRVAGPASTSYLHTLVVLILLAFLHDVVLREGVVGLLRLVLIPQVALFELLGRPQLSLELLLFLSDEHVDGLAIEVLLVDEIGRQDLLLHLRLLLNPALVNLTHYHRGGLVHWRASQAVVLLQFGLRVRWQPLIDLDW